MSYQHTLLGKALGWKYGYPEGIRTCEGVLTHWPTQPWPTVPEQAAAVDEYEAYLASTQRKDDEWQAFLDSPAGKAIKALALVGIEKGLFTAAELKAKYRSLL